MLAGPNSNSDCYASLSNALYGLSDVGISWRTCHCACGALADNTRRDLAMSCIFRVRWLRVGAVALGLFTIAGEDPAGPPQMTAPAQQAVAAFAAAWKPHEVYMRPWTMQDEKHGLLPKNHWLMGAEVVLPLETTLEIADVELHVFAAPRPATIAQRPTRSCNCWTNFTNSTPSRHTRYNAWHWALPSRTACTHIPHNTPARASTENYASLRRSP